MPDAAEARPQKTCVRCGTDLTGKPRLKDKKGYWCTDCTEAERRERARNLPVKCEECDRTVPRYTIVKVSGRKLCDMCGEGQEPDPSDPSDSIEMPAQKLCDGCGKDVAEEKRLWNGKGYFCVTCDAAERQKAREKTEGKSRVKTPKLRCLECGRKVPADSLVKVNGLEVCVKCAADLGAQAEPQGPDRPDEDQIEVRPPGSADEERPQKRTASQARSRWAEQDVEDTRSRRRKLVIVVVAVLLLLFVSLYLNGVIRL